MKKFLLLLVVLAVAFAGFRHIRYSRGLSPVESGSEERIVVKIPKGSSVSVIASILEEQGAVRSAWAFRKYVSAEGLDSKVQAGSFVLTKSMDVPEIVAAMTEGQASEVIVTIPEGYTVKNIDALLTEKNLVASGDLIACAKTCDFSDYGFLPKSADLADRGGRVEGYLYPDTYFVMVEDFTAEAFLHRLLDTFEARVIEEHAAEIAASKRTLHEMITMASLIEEETRTDDERAVVSGILWKRFDEGIGLGVDAAVRYIIDKPTATITASDLDTDSPYNLRKYRGLPPGPIANPSLQSIEAALEPESSQYYYYLHGTDGQIRYAVTNDEHNANRAKYLR
jgi:UPF0755 protein